MSERKKEQAQQKEQIEVLSGIPFYSGPFNTKSGPRKPLQENLYLNTTMRRFFLGDNPPKKGQVTIGDEIFDVRQARHAVTDSRIRNVIHGTNLEEVSAEIHRRLEELPKGEKIVDYYTGEFKTKKGPRFPEGGTIYASSKLRKALLGNDELTGTIEIEGRKFKVRQARKPVDKDEFVNVVHPVEEPIVQKFLREQNINLQIERKGTKEKVEKVLE